MDQQVMELLARIDQRQTEMQNELKDTRADQEKLAHEVNRIATVLEHDVAEKIGAIFGFCEVQIEHNQKTDLTLERLEAKVEILQLETSSLTRIK